MSVAATKRAASDWTAPRNADEYRWSPIPMTTPRTKPRTDHQLNTHTERRTCKTANGAENANRRRKVGKDTTGGGKDTTGGDKDTTRGDKDASAVDKDTTGGDKDTTGDDKDAAAVDCSGRGRLHKNLPPTHRRNQGQSQSRSNRQPRKAELRSGRERKLAVHPRKRRRSTPALRK